MKRRILIDLTDLKQWSGHFGGIQRVVYNVARNFSLDESTKYELGFIYFDTASQQFRLTDFGAAPDETRVSTRQKTGLLGRLTTKLQPRHNAVQPIHFGSNDIVLILGKPWDDLNIINCLVRQKAQYHFKLVHLVCDLVPCLYPHLQNPVVVGPFNQHMAATMEHADMILAISQSTARDIEKYCSANGIKTPPTKVVRLGDEIAERNESPLIIPDTLLNRPFIACVGTLEIRKNHMLLYYAYKLAAEKHIDLPLLVIVGSRGWLTDNVHYLLTSDPDLKDKVLLIHDADDAGLNWIYENCLFTVYPSLYEGWGLPIAESAAYGKLCLSSDASSMPEIAGDLIDYFSPYDAGECLEKMSRYLDAGMRRQKEKALTSKYVQTNWTQTHRQIVDALVRENIL